MGLQADIATAVAQITTMGMAGVLSLAWERAHAVGAAKNPHKKQKTLDDTKS